MGPTLQPFPEVPPPPRVPAPALALVLVPLPLVRLLEWEWVLLTPLAVLSFVVPGLTALVMPWSHFRTNSRLMRL